MFQKKTLCRIAVLVVSAASLTGLLSSCASTPAKTPEPTKPAVEAVTDAEFQAARDAIAEAEAAGAVELAPEPLSQAKGALADAEKTAPTDPEAARVLLKKSIAKANEARDAALAKKAAQWKVSLDALDQEAVAAIAEAEEAGAAQSAAELLAQAKDALAQARDQVASLPETAKASYETSIDKAHQARDAARRAALSDELKALFDRLDAEAQQAIADAVAAGAEETAAELLDGAKQALTRAQGQIHTAPDDAKASYQSSIDQAREAKKTALAVLDQAAQDAIAEAEAFEAERYSPKLLEQARQTLSRARTESANPGAARADYLLAAEKAREARDDASKGRTQSLLDQLDAALARLTGMNAESWDPGTTEVMAKGRQAKEAVAADYATGRPVADEALKALDEAASRLSTRLAAVEDLKVQAQKALDEAEAADAYVWVPDLVQSANDAFFAGTGAWKKFLLDAAEEGWSTATFQARSATAQAQAALERKRTEQLMLETMKKLEDASGKTIVDPQDNIIGPQPWDGKKELEKLKTKPVSIRIPADGSVVVLGEKQRVTYLDEAKDQWARGVKALEAGDLTLANESFLQAQRLIDTYLLMAVDKVYTVRLIPERRDSLWRISEYDGIYGTPWDWPRIWKRNQKLIQNPDLIYPGWQLIIPPQ